MKPRPTIYETQRAVVALARQLARRQVLINIRHSGRKLREFTVSDIQKFAGDYALAHWRSQGNLRRTSPARIAQAGAGAATPCRCET